MLSHGAAYLFAAAESVLVMAEHLRGWHWYARHSDPVWFDHRLQRLTGTAAPAYRRLYSCFHA